SELLRKRSQVGVMQSNEQTGFGAELADTDGHGFCQALGDFCAAGLHRIRQDEDWIYAAHLGEDRNRDRTSSSSIEKRAATLQGSSESDCTGCRVAHQRDAQRWLGAMHE